MTKEEAIKLYKSKWWKDKTGTVLEHPWCRDTYKSIGYGDDSMRLTKDLFDNIKGDLESYQSEDSWICLDHYANQHDYLDDSVELKDIIDRNMIYNPDDVHQTKHNVKWLTVVDYHN